MRIENLEAAAEMAAELKFFRNTLETLVNKSVIEITDIAELSPTNKPTEKAYWDVRKILEEMIEADILSTEEKLRAMGVEIPSV